MGALRTLGFGVVLLFATLGGWMMVSGKIALLTFAVLLWAWARRDRVSGQGTATVLCGFAMIALGASNFFLAPARELKASDAGAAQLLAIPGIGALLLGVGLGVAACLTVARGKARSRWWAVLGWANIVGFAVMLALPSRQPVADALATE
jgi:hypothetical protein